MIPQLCGRISTQRTQKGAAKSGWSSVANSAWGWFNKPKQDQVQVQEEAAAIELKDVVDSQLTKSIKTDSSIIMNSLKDSMISSHPLSQAIILDDAEADNQEVGNSMAAAAA